MSDGLERLDRLLSYPRVHLRGLEETVREIVKEADLTSKPDLIRYAMRKLESDRRQAETASAFRTLSLHLRRVELSLQTSGTIELPTSASHIEVVSAVSEELLARLAEHPRERFELDWRVFEEVVAELLSRMGWEVRLTARSGDHGRDILAFSEVSPVPLLTLVECKRYAEHRLIGPDPISRLLYQMNIEGANAVMVVTTSGFQPCAKQMAVERKYQVKLADGTDFIGWVNKLRRGAKC